MSAGLLVSDSAVYGAPSEQKGSVYGDLGVVSSEGLGQKGRSCGLSAIELGQSSMTSRGFRTMRSFQLSSIEGSGFNVASFSPVCCSSHRTVTAFANAVLTMMSLRAYMPRW